MSITVNPIFDFKPQQPSLYYIDDGCAIGKCTGNPEGLVASKPGGQLNSDNGHLYFKATGNAATGWVQVDGGGGGSGTVTSFSAGDLSPLFTSLVSNPTTTPALAFTQVNQSANKVFAGPTTGAAAAPTFRSLVANDIPALADPPALSVQYNNGANVFEGDAGLTFDPTTASLLLGSSGGQTGQLFLRNTNGFSIKLFTNNPVDQNVTWPDALPAATGRVMAVAALSGSNWTIGYLSQSAFLDLIGSTQGQLLYRDASGWTTLNAGTAGQVLQSGGAGANPSWLTITATATGANPSVSVTLATQNGVAATFMRSDAAPPLDQSIAPTWTGVHIHSLSNAAAWAIGPNGNTNPVVRVVTNVASQADGVSISGGAAGAGVTFQALSSGSNAPVIINTKGTGSVQFENNTYSMKFDSGATTGFTLSAPNPITYFSSGNNRISLLSTVHIGWTNGNPNAGIFDIALCKGGSGSARVSNGTTGIGSLQITQNGVTALGQFHVEPTSTSVKPIYVNLPSGGTVSAIQVQNNLSDRFVVSPTGKVTNNQNGVQAVTTCGRYTSDVTDHNNASTTQTDLYTNTMPANLLGTNLDVITWTFSGIFAANANAKTVKVLFDGVTMFTTGALLFNGSAWTITCKIYRVSSSVQRVITYWQSSDALLTSAVTYSDATSDLTTNLIIKTTGQGGATDDVTNKMADAIIEPA